VGLFNVGCFAQSVNRDYAVEAEHRFQYDERKGSKAYTNGGFETVRNKGQHLLPESVLVFRGTLTVPYTLNGLKAVPIWVW
jgi:hypothetical protein